MEIVSVMDNCSSAPQLHAEHGLSFFIRRDDACYLLDTGASEKFLENANRMGIDLKNLDGVIISHNHYDHTGGLPALLSYNKDVKVYIKSAAKSAFYYKVLCFKKNLGEKKDLFLTHADRFVFFDGAYDLSDSVHLLSDTVRDGAYACRDTNLLEKKDGRFIPDPFQHELFLVVEENGRLVILSSCSHSGIVNIVNTVREQYPGKPISHIIGGFHFAAIGVGAKPSKLNCGEEYVREVARILRESCPEIHTCHCTGKAAYTLMREETSGAVRYFEAGNTIRIE